MFQHTKIVKPGRTPITPIYNPNLHNRPCSTCGARDRWQRLLDGGWYCCWAGPTPASNAEMAHTCAPVCAGAA